MKKILGLALCSSSLFAVQPPVYNYAPTIEPWFTGPLVTSSSNVIPVGHYNIEPYVGAVVYYGSYDSHWHNHKEPKFYSVGSYTSIQLGVIERVDVQLVPQAYYQSTEKASSLRLGDMPVLVDIQLVNEDRHGWVPGVKLSAKANIPIGPYQKLNPDKLGTDAIGTGSWLPALSVIMGKLIHFSDFHFLSLRWAFQWGIPSSAHVRGFNSYGGGYGTAGTVHIGASYDGFFALEYNFTRNWALAMDVVYAHSNKTKFSGVKGAPFKEAIFSIPNAAIGSASSEQLSLAPAIEYNWNENVGLIAGAWFSVAGRNASNFCSGIVAVNIYK